MGKNLRSINCSSYCYIKTSANAQAALCCAESYLALSTFSTFKKLAMNTLSKSNSIALAIALGFSMLATSTSLNAQSSDRDDAASGRVANVQPTTKPTVSFRASVKNKIKTTSVTKPIEAKVSTPAVVKTAAVNTTPAASQWTNEPVDKDSNTKDKDQFDNKRAVMPTKSVRVINNTAPKSVNPPAASNKVLEYQPDASMSAEENQKANENFYKGREVATTPALKVVSPVAVPVAAVKYENASPAGKAKVEIHPNPTAPIQISKMVDENITHDSKGSLIRETQNDSKK